MMRSLTVGVARAARNEIKLKLWRQDSCMESAKAAAAAVGALRDHGNTLLSQNSRPAALTQAALSLEQEPRNWLTKFMQHTSF